MAEIRLDTELLGEKATRIILDVVQPLCRDQRSIAASESLARDWPYCDSFTFIVQPIIQQAYAEFLPLIPPLSESATRLKAIVDLFKGLDESSIDQWNGLKEKYPSLFDNFDLTLLLIMQMTGDELASLYPYGNLLDPSNNFDLDKVLGRLTVELTQIKPGTPAAKEALDDFLKTHNLDELHPGSWLAELYISDMMTRELDPNSPEAKQFEDFVARNYGLDFQGDWTGHEWEKLMAVKGTVLVAEKLAETMGMTSAEAFRMAYETSSENPLIYFWGTDQNQMEDKYRNRPDYQLSGTAKGISKGGCTSNQHLINFMYMSGTNGHVDQRGMNNVIHELGHALGSRACGRMEDHMQNDYWQPPYNGQLGNRANGFASPPPPPFDWQQSDEKTSTPGEVFADMFLGWVCDKWEQDPTNPGDLTQAGQARKDFMDSHMPEFLDILKEGKDESEYYSRRDYFVEKFAELEQRDAAINQPEAG
jgi:hypothetical protein